MIHFTESELSRRREKACDVMTKSGLDGLLIFRQESMYYLTGYDTFGFVFFQCLYMDADGRMILLTRSADIRQAEITSVITDIREWHDSHNVNPIKNLKSILIEQSCQGKKLGVEWQAYGLNARDGSKLSSALEGFCELADASNLITELRAVKTRQEIIYTRAAANLADKAWEALLPEVYPGAHESNILNALQSEIFKGGGDFPANDPIIGSGPYALLCRYHTGRRRLDEQDQLTLEWAGSYRMYHAAMMRTICIGKVPKRQLYLYEVALEALEAVHDSIRPGNTFGDGFSAHQNTMKKRGLTQHRLNACGYSLGATYAPTWMDWPMLYEGNPVKFSAGMVIFTHMIIFDSPEKLAMSLGETILVHESGIERLSLSSRNLMCK